MWPGGVHLGCKKNHLGPAHLQSRTFKAAKVSFWSLYDGHMSLLAALCPPSFFLLRTRREERWGQTPLCLYLSLVWRSVFFFFQFKIKTGLFSQRCNQIRGGWAPPLGSGKSCWPPCYRCPSLGALESVRTRCRCSAWSCGWRLNAPTLCRQTGH